MATYIPPKKNTAFIIYCGLPSAATSTGFQSTPTLAAGDAKVSIDGGALTNLATLPAVTPASSKMVKIDLSSSEMNGDNITVVLSDQTSPPEWADVVINIQTSAQQIDDLATQTSVNTIDDLLDTEIPALTTAVADLPTNAELATALGTADDATLAAIAAVDAKIDIIDTNVDAILVDTGTTLDAAIAVIDGNVDAILVDTGTTLDGKIDAILVDTGTDIPATIADLPTNAELATALGTADDAVLAAIAALNNPTVGAIADAVWDEPLSGHLTAGTTGAELNDAGTAAVAPTASAIADEVETRTLDANIVQVNSITVDGVGTEADPWGP
jgi:hypothetical protein